MSSRVLLEVPSEDLTLEQRPDEAEEGTLGISEGREFQAVGMNFSGVKE